MTLNKRERILAVATGVLAVLIVGRWILSAAGGRMETLRNRRDALAAEVEKKKARVAGGRKATGRLTGWQSRSLPADREMARSLYQNWLLALVDRVGLRRARVESGEARPRRGIYWRLSFTVRGRGSLEQLTRLLWDFYSAGHLHQLRRLSIKPIEDSSELELALAIEALSLPGADNRDRLSSARPPCPPARTLAEYRKSIVERNLFGPYVPPPPPPPPVVKTAPPPPPPPSFDHTKYTVVTAIVEVDGRRQVWLKVRTTDEQFKLFEGDTFKVGPIECTVVKVSPREVEIEVDGHRRRLGLGDNLHDGAASS